MVINTKVVFITHLHGDHQLGVLKFLVERDKLISSKDDVLYLVAPWPMREWLDLFIEDSLKHPDCVKLITSNNLNPERSYFYQKKFINTKMN